MKRHGFQPGISGNPGGKLPVPPELRMIQSLTRPEINKIISKYARMDISDLRMLIDKDGNITKISGIDAAVVSVLIKAIQFGDSTRLNFLLDQAIGKVPVSDESDEDKLAREALRSMSDKEMIELGKKALAELESAKK